MDTSLEKQRVDEEAECQTELINLRSRPVKISTDATTTNKETLYQSLNVRKRPASSTAEYQAARKDLRPRPVKVSTDATTTNKETRFQSLHTQQRQTTSTESENSTRGIETLGKRGQIKKLYDNTFTSREYLAIGEQIKSVGILMDENKPIGTVFVVGKNYVLTTWHNVHFITYDELTNTLDYSKLDNASINFNDYPTKHTTQNYRIEQTPAFEDEGLDVAILKIKKTFRKLPKPLSLCKNDITEPNSGVTGFTLIGYGHPDKHTKCIEKVSLIGPESKRATEATAHLNTKWGESDKKTKSDYYKFIMEAIRSALGAKTEAALGSVDYGYTGYDLQSNLICDCYMMNGSSGSPALTTKLYQGTACVVGILKHGLPDFYYYLPEEFQETFPDYFRFELATKMSSVYVSLYRKNESLAKQLNFI